MTAKRFISRSRALRLLFLMLFLVAANKAGAETGQPLTDAQIVDSLFIRASSGEVKYRDLVEPSKQALIKMGEAAIPEMLTKLGTRDARESHTVVDIFKGIGEVAVVPLISKLKSRDSFARRLAIRCLGEIKSPRAVPALVKLAADDDFRTRAGVMAALGKIGDVAGAQAVLRGLNDSDEIVATAAAVACGRIKQDIPPGLLIAALSSHYYGVRYSAMNSLVRLGAEAVEPITARLESRTASLETGYLIEALGRLKTKKALSVLKPWIYNPDWAVRGFAAQALGECGRKKAKKILRNALKKETHPFVIKKITDSLKSLDGG